MNYLLRLSENKEYVGHTGKENVMDRLMPHFLQTQDAAEWTKLYRPLEVLLVRPGNEMEEHALTLERMKLRGYENVRGGKYCKPVMTEPPVELLLLPAFNMPIKQLALKVQDLAKSSDTCQNCNQPGHFARDCRLLYCYLCGDRAHISSNCPNRSKIICYKCGQKGHTQKQCPESKSLCFNCRKPGHYASQCPQPKNNNNLIQIQQTKTYGACNRCGLYGHWASKCPEH